MGLRWIPLVGLTALALQGCGAAAQNTAMPEQGLGLRYRIELMEEKGWRPVEATRSFGRNQTIRFRFMSNVAGTLYVLNTSDQAGSLHPAFSSGSGPDLRRFLGQGAHIGSDEVGVFPPPPKGGGLRFTGTKERERFLFAYVPDDGGKREILAIPAGAENWMFDDGMTYMVTEGPDRILFHYFELKSR